MSISFFFFLFGFIGLITNRKNLLYIIIYIEIILLGIMVYIFTYSYNIYGNIIILTILTVSAVETSLGLCFLILFFKQKGHLLIKYYNLFLQK